MSIEFSTRIDSAEVAPTFEAMRFPAGEAHVKVVNDNAAPAGAVLVETARVFGADANDLLALAMWADAAHQRGARTVAFIPYLPGARQDRGLPFGAKVYADLINGMGLGQVVCVDPHSPVIVGLVENLTIVDVVPIVRDRVAGSGSATIQRPRPGDDQATTGRVEERADRRGRVEERTEQAGSGSAGEPYAGIICPDQGAIARSTRFAEACGLPLYQAYKHRNPDTGKLSGFTCDTLPAAGRFLVVDDICDGGGTFRGLADATGLGPDRLDLFVTHGVFSGKAAGLHESYGKIFTTDSYSRTTPAGVSADIIELDSHLVGAIA